MQVTGGKFKFRMAITHTHTHLRINIYLYLITDCKIFCATDATEVDLLSIKISMPQPCLRVHGIRYNLNVIRGHAFKINYNCALIRKTMLKINYIILCFKFVPALKVSRRNYKLYFFNIYKFNEKKRTVMESK